ncbi:GPI mannosyltransferase 2 [Orussus abietinus]|uniref:GPI mannosyltransferase 2 n=1 Tax=Orussus abietinus TaxID=222816 RepID=UPI000626DE02|nr:GPI mannosyltransferase 2 [Orussus abietinus]
MYGPREKVFWFAITSRVGVIMWQFVCNAVCSDHDADAFRSPLNPLESTGFFDRVIHRAFSGLTRWDAQYFIHIAKYGYTYENTLAFFPLFPMSIRGVAMIIGRFLFILNKDSVIVISAVLINLACFVKSAVIFYDLSLKVLKNNDVAYKAGLLYCINPASIFFTAFYTESMFAYLSFYGMLASVGGNSFDYLPIGLSTIVRSNGLVNLGFPVYTWLNNFLTLIATEYQGTSLFKAFMSSLFRFFLLGLSIFNTVFLSLVPFILLQVYNYMEFCTSTSVGSYMPEHVLRYGIENDLILPGSGNVTWCYASVPMAYAYVQKTYWNVGFMEYYTFRQIPNFLVALPALFLMYKCSLEYLLQHKERLLTTDLAPRAKEREKPTRWRYPPEMFVFVVHGLLLTLFCTFFVHIQVSTRLLASASPLIYWYCAFALSYKPSSKSNTYDELDNTFSKWRVFLMTQKHYTVIDKLIYSYFLGYLVVGTFMYSNFLPWT